VGPALGLARNTARYRTAWSPQSDVNREATWRVVRTEDELPLDAMVSLSAYLWGRRYLDGAVFDPMQLLPRPMIGLSLASPLDTLYAGLQIDPVQFLDVSAGVRFAPRERLVGPQVLDRALVTPDGEPQPPVTRSEVRPDAFVAVTLSANMIYDWIAGGR